MILLSVEAASRASRCDPAGWHKLQWDMLPSYAKLCTRSAARLSFSPWRMRRGAVTLARWRCSSSRQRRKAMPSPSFTPPVQRSLSLLSRA